jgi:hypothetical protein
MSVTWANEAARWGYGYALYHEVYYMLKQLIKDTIVAKWPHVRNLQINDLDQFDVVYLNPYIKLYILDNIL